jgi:diaminopropionate ammonia-lyase
MAEGTIETDAGPARALYALCPVAAETPMIDANELAEQFDVAKLHLKDERQRMGLGSFKATGAAYAIAKMAATRADARDAMQTALEDVSFVCGCRQPWAFHGCAAIVRSKGSGLPG